MSKKRFAMAFTSITSQSDHKFPSDVALRVLKDSIVKFYDSSAAEVDNLRLIYVETTALRLSPDDKSLFSPLEKRLGGSLQIVDLSRSSSLVSLCSDGVCERGELLAVVNSANARLSGRGGLVNQLIHAAAGAELEEKSLALSSDLGAGYQAPHVFTVPLSARNPLRVKEGVVAVIQAVSPSLNPAKPFCEPSLDAAVAALEETYRRVFADFRRLARVQCSSSDEGVGVGISVDNSDDNYHTAKRPRVDHNSDDSQSTTQQHQQQASSVQHTSSASATTSHKPNFGFNKGILYEYLRHPERHAAEIVSRSDVCTVIRDAYPKARCHLLLIPAEGYLGTAVEVRQLTPEHLQRVTTMHDAAKKVAAEQSASSSVTGLHFNVGYHAAPSLHPLHLHIVSDDLAAEAMRTKKHWNSFATAHFVPVDTVQEWLASGLTAASQLPSESALHDLIKSTPLRCNKCDAEFKTMPALKTHLLTHNN